MMLKILTTSASFSSFLKYEIIATWGLGLFSLLGKRRRGKKKSFFPRFHILIFDEFSPFHPNEAISSFGSVFDDSEHRISRNEEKKKQKCAPSPLMI